MVRIPGFHPGGPGSIPGMGTFSLFFYTYLCSKHSFSLSLSFFVEVRGKGNNFFFSVHNFVDGYYGIKIVMSADMWGTDHTRWLPGETGHTEVCTLAIGEFCDVW